MRFGVPIIEGIPEAVRKAEEAGIVVRAADGAHWKEKGHKIVSDVLKEYFEKKKLFRSRQVVMELLQESDRIACQRAGLPACLLCEPKTVMNNFRYLQKKVSFGKAVADGLVSLQALTAERRRYLYIGGYPYYIFACLILNEIC